MLPGDCRSCHSEDRWAQFGGQKRFDHKLTPFELKGKHRSIDCKSCHALDKGAQQVFQEHLGVAENACATCHQDPHQQKFGQDCAACHTETSFLVLKTPQTFNHALTGFVLEGKHSGLDCKACHKEKMTDPLKHVSCTDCHKDYHDGQFAEGGKIKDCSGCHIVQGFEVTIFGIEQHANTRFPLSGAHIATPCSDCHKPSTAGIWQFREVGTKCIDCHHDIHKGEIQEKYYPNQECTICHSTDSWEDQRFDHSLTRFQLDQSHIGLKCKKCHGQEDKPDRKFLSLPMECAACHTDQHQKQFADVSGITSRDRCHDPHIG